MYQVGKRDHKHRKFWKRTAWVVSLVLIGAVIYGLFNLTITPEQNIRNAAPVSKAYDAATPKKITIDDDVLKLELPEGWKAVKPSPYELSPAYMFQSLSEDMQILKIYIDNPPQDLAFNKAIAVSSVAGKIAHEAVSDNCTSYTDAAKANPRTGVAAAKWQGIDFNCDVANYARAVVGTVSKDGLNYVNVTGAKTGTHKVFITYTDNSISPDYTTLYEILDSMQFK